MNSQPKIMQREKYNVIPFKHTQRIIWNKGVILPLHSTCSTNMQYVLKLSDINHVVISFLLQRLSQSSYALFSSTVAYKDPLGTR